MVPDLRLVLEAPATLPLDEVLVATVSLEAGPVPITVSARLNIIEGDLAVEVTTPGGPGTGAVAICRWPWPVDALSRVVELAAGQRLVAAVALVATDTSAPLFPAPGAYMLRALFDVAPGMTVASDPVRVRRTAAADPGRAAALRDRAVLQSLLSASALHGADEGLAVLERAPTVATRTLAALALGRLVTLAGDGAGADEEVARAVSSVLPPGYAERDPRRADLASAARRGTVAAALLAGEAIPI